MRPPFPNRSSAFACLALVAVVAVSVCARADDAETPDEILSGIVDTVDVVGDRPEPGDEIERLPIFATVHDVGDRLDDVATVADVLEEGAGVAVTRYGGLGAYSTASIRGSSAAQVEVYLDGVPMRSAQWGVTDLADLSLVSLERIEVFRGGAPVEFGTAGIGGVINLVTKDVGGPRLVTELTLGSHGTWRAGVLSGDDVGPVRVIVSLHHLRSRGDFEYLDRHGTPENDEDDRIVERTNNEFSQTDLLVRVRPPAVAGWRFDVSESLFWKDSGLPGIENVRIDSAGFDVTRSILRATIEAPPALGQALLLSGIGFHQYRLDRFYNPADEVGLNRSDTDNRSRAYGVNGLTTLRWYRARQTLKLFGEAKWERFVPEDANPRIGVGFTRKRRTGTVSLEDRLSLLDDALAIVAGYRYQESVDNYTGPVPFGAPPAPRDDPHWSVFHGPQFGVRWQPTEFLTLRANRVRYERFPSMLELFGANGSVEGNPELVPEEGTTEDVGATLRFGALSFLDCRLEASVFRSDREDLIAFLQNSQRTTKAFNLESAHVEGIEFSSDIGLGREWRITGSYTFQDARNTGLSPVYGDKRLPYVPEHELFVRTKYDVGRVTLWHEYHMEGGAYRDRANLPENLSPGKHIHSVGVSVRPHGLLRISAEIQNLTDVQITDVEGYPLPGRSMFVTVQFDSSSGDKSQ